MIVLIIIVIILFGIALILYYLTEKNKKNDTDFIPTPLPTQKVEMYTATPTPTVGPVATETAKNTATPTLTVKPTATPAVKATATPSPTTKPVVIPTNTPTPVVIQVASGVEKVPVHFRNAVSELAEQTKEKVELWGGREASAPVITISVYTYPAITSVVFDCTATGFKGTHREAYNFDTETGARLTVKEVFHETYLAILKERLQTYALEKDKVFENTSFVTYDEAYRTSDYEQFYFDEIKAVFIFGYGTLTDLLHEEFTYEVDMSEARAFMIRDLNGYTTGSRIRMNLDPDKPMIALTYNSGPYEPVESKLIEMFNRYNAKATFFAIGSRIDSSKSAKNSIKLIAEAGHEVGSTAYNSKSFKSEDCDKELFWTEINKNNLSIAKAIGYAPLYIRMSKGRDRLDYMAKHMPMPMINWSVDPKDWSDGIINASKSTPEKVTAKAEEVAGIVEKNAKDGQIVLLASLYDSTAEATELILERLSKEGYQFVTLSELFYYRGVTPENGRVTSATTSKNKINKDYSD